MAGRILIVDDVATNRIVLKVKLSAARYETMQAGSGAEALRLVGQYAPDLILLDVQLPDMSGLEVLRRLKADPATAGIPVLMITAFPDPRTRLEALRAGAADHLMKPLDEQLLLARLRSLLRLRETEQELTLRERTFRDLGFAEGPALFETRSRIALIGCTRDEARSWKRCLAHHLGTGSAVVVAREDALGNGAVAQGYDAYVISADLGRPGDGLRLMSELHSRARSRDAVICIALPEGASDSAAMALDLGAADLLPEVMGAPFAAQEAALRLDRALARKHRHERLRDHLTDGLRLAMTDPLTGLHNRRYAMSQLARLAERARSTGRPFAVMALDLDRFKSVNDTWGHAAGDAVLVEVAQRLRAQLRQVDLLARIGGEEFLVALPETGPEAAQASAERLCQAISEAPIELPEGETEPRAIQITASIGLALCDPLADSAPVEALIARADRALLGSKAGGRNQVRVFRHDAAA
ncbi:diguanylate cyclase [Sinirhodobacter ferrireducens]|uniref:diguanylate cyclase n=1 Tax=Paenirhodobacter ferrireducens TaxID=1215032 RepID=A0A443LJI0_9RHOB|nr:diguanylate cyclase [Sinirhodobacter ferrireducens]RWR49344.1 diguanylate cyclase [Sinirhodobacter ferrireducens]